MALQRVALGEGHLTAGLRLLVIELRPWRGPRHGLIGLGAGASLLVGALFLWSAF